MSAGSTPAIAACRRAGVDHRVHRYHHNRSVTAFGDEAVAALGPQLGLGADRFFKTLVIDLHPGGRAVALVPVPTHLSLKAAAAALGGRRAAMADPVAAERATGYVRGGISPLGQRTTLPTVIDAAITDGETVLVSAGRRGLQLELAPADLVRLTGAVVAPITAG